LLFDKVQSLGLTGNERWFVVHSLPRSELRAQTHLHAQGFRIFLPRLLKTVRHARQLRTVCTPLFSRYLFVILDLERDRFLSVQSTVGVASLFGFKGRPLPVPAGVVESLIAQTGESNMIRLDGDLAEGQRVRILSGPFADLVGMLKGLDKNGRARVLLEIMGSAMPVTLQRAVLSKVA
jgi:transcription elongation factor/antiterminator RfaH